MIKTPEDAEKICLDYKIPSYMIPGVKRYIFDHVKPGGFMISVFSNDLIGAMTRADPQNIQVLQGWVSLMRNHMPVKSYGSRDKVDKWLMEGPF